MPLTEKQQEQRAIYKRYSLWILGALLVLGMGYQWFLRDAPEDEATVKLGGTIFGTTYQITIADTLTQAQEQALRAEIDTRLTTINTIASTWEDDSELMQLNFTPINEPRLISSTLAAVLQEGIAVGELTHGYYEMTIGKLVNYWGFGAVDTHAAEDDSPAVQAATVSALLAEMGYAGLVLSCSDCTAPYATRTKDFSLDLSGLAKGWAVEQISLALAAAGFVNHLVEIGGEVCILGDKFSEPWQVGIQKPDGDSNSSVQGVVSLSGARQCMATSGDYRNYRIEDGVRLSHIIDPKSGYFVTHNLASVSVLGDSGGVTDALATAFMAMGAEAALALAEAQDIPIFMLVRKEVGFEEIFSNAWTAQVDFYEAP